jgi:hypothetical protein
MIQNDEDSAKFEVSLKYVQEHVFAEAANRAQGEMIGILVHIFITMRDSKIMKDVAIDLHEAVLVNVCTAFYADLFRIEAFHSLHYAADDHKKAALLFKWISRLRPVTPRGNAPHKLKGLAVKANGVFAMLCAFSFLDIPPFTPIHSERDHIIYSSIYRDLQPQEWAMIFYLLEKLYKKLGLAAK